MYTENMQVFTQKIQTTNVILHVGFKIKVCDQIWQNTKIYIYLCDGA